MSPNELIPGTLMVFQSGIRSVELDTYMLISCKEVKKNQPLKYWNLMLFSIRLNKLLDEQYQVDITTLESKWKRLDAITK